MFSHVLAKSCKNCVILCKNNKIEKLIGVSVAQNNIVSDDYRLFGLCNVLCILIVTKTKVLQAYVVNTEY